MQKSEPGPFIELEDVKKKLARGAYGAFDLVELGLFYSEHFVRDAMTSGKLKFDKVNKRSVIIYADDVLDYWKRCRSEPYEVPNNILSLKLTISEVDYVVSLVMYGQKHYHKELTKDDLFRNLIHLIKSEGNIVDNPNLYIKR